jgi:hypothetical protein
LKKCEGGFGENPKPTVIVWMGKGIGDVVTFLWGKVVFLCPYSDATTKPSSLL